MTSFFKVLLISILGVSLYVAYRSYNEPLGADSAMESLAATGFSSAVPRPPASGFSEPRTALVIGNSTYGGGASLPNAGNDARAMAQALRETGFKVVLHLDLDQTAMEQAIQTFADSLRKEEGVALFYYSGHAFQSQGRSFLAPVGAAIASETDARFKTVDVEYVMGHMEEAGSRMKIVILDACRDNPLTRGFKTRGLSLQGLSRVDAPTGTLIAYATSPGKTAADGIGRHSPYTQALLEVMRTPGLPLEQTFKEVRIRVAEATRNAQIPWESSSLLGEFYFLPGASGPALANAAMAPPSAPAELAPEPRPAAALVAPPDSAASGAAPKPYVNAKQAPPERAGGRHPPVIRSKRKGAPSPDSTDLPASNDDYFARKAKDLERFLESPKTRHGTERSARNGDPYFKNLSSDMERFLRR